MSITIEGLNCDYRLCEHCYRFVQGLSW